MVYDTISDNIVQIGISIANGAELDYDIVLKKHVSNIKEISFQFSALCGIPVVVNDISSVPTTNVLTTPIIFDVNVHTSIWDPAATSPLNVQQVGRVLNINSDTSLAGIAGILYLRILFDRAGDI